MLKWLKNQVWLRSFYFLTAAAFVVWMLFFDGNNWRIIYRNWSNLNAAKREKAYYLEQKAAVIKERDEVMGNPTLLEKYAREHYLMKKPTEDLFIVEEPKQEE